MGLRSLRKKRLLIFYLNTLKINLKNPNRCKPSLLGRKKAILKTQRLISRNQNLWITANFGIGIIFPLKESVLGYFDYAPPIVKTILRMIPSCYWRAMVSAPRHRPEPPQTEDELPRCSRCCGQTPSVVRPFGDTSATQSHLADCMLSCTGSTQRLFWKGLARWGQLWMTLKVMPRVDQSCQGGFIRADLSPFFQLPPIEVSAQDAPQKTPCATKSFTEAAVWKPNLQHKLCAPASRSLCETLASFKSLMILISSEWETGVRRPGFGWAIKHGYSGGDLLDGLYSQGKTAPQATDRTLTSFWTHLLTGYCLWLGSWRDNCPYVIAVTHTGASTQTTSIEPVQGELLVPRRGWMYTSCLLPLSTTKKTLAITYKTNMRRLNNGEEPDKLDETRENYAEWKKKSTLKCYTRYDPFI